LYSPWDSNPEPADEQVIDEIAATRLTERGATRADDRVTEAAMEDRKKEGYFRPRRVKEGACGLREMCLG